MDLSREAKTSRFGRPAFMLPRRRMIALLLCWLVLGFFFWRDPPNLHDSNLAIGVVLTTLLAVAAWKARAVTPDGALAGYALSIVLYAAFGPPMFAALVTVFLLTWAATRYRRRRKGPRATERSHGRTANQVAANIGPAAALSAAPFISLVFLHPEFMHFLASVAALAALAEVAGDTVSSEYGEGASDHAYLITTAERVAAGTEGAVSRAGTYAGVLSAAIVWVVWLPFSLIYPEIHTHPLPISERLLGLGFHGIAVVLAAYVGMSVDSILGATLERHGIIGNDVVNLLGASSAAATAFGVYVLAMGLTTT